MKKTFKKSLIRLISYLLTFAFFANNVLYSSPRLWAAENPSLNTALSHSLQNFPAELGILKEFSVPAASTSLVVIIQDAHANPDAQLKIKNILDWLIQHSPDSHVMIGLESAVGPLHPEYADFSNRYPTMNQAIVEDMYRKGELTGAELLAWDLYKKGAWDKFKSHFVGIETPELYRKNLLSYRRLLYEQKEVQTILDPLRKDLDLAKSRFFSQELRDFFREKDRRREGKFGSVDQAATMSQLTSYLPYISNLAKSKLEIDLQDRIEQLRFPNITRIFALDKLQKELNKNLAEHQQASLIHEVNTKARLQADKDLLLNLQNFSALRRPRAVLEDTFDFAGRYQMDLANTYSEFLKKSGTLILQSEIDPEGLFAELDQLEEKILRKMIQNDFQRKTVQLVSDFSRLEKLLALKLTRSEYEHSKNDLEALKSSALNARLEELLKKKAKSKIADSDYFSQAQEFYETAVHRDQALLDNLLKNQSDSKTHVLIAGGFHAGGVSSLLRSQSRAYAVIQPRIEDLEEKGLSEKVFKDQNADLSKYFLKHPLNKQEALLLKELLEVGLPELAKSEKLSQKDVNSETQRILETHPVLSQKLISELVTREQKTFLEVNFKNSQAAQTIQAVGDTLKFVTASQFDSLRQPLQTSNPDSSYAGTAVEVQSSGIAIGRALPPRAEARASKYNDTGETALKESAAMKKNRLAMKYAIEMSAIEARVEDPFEIDWKQISESTLREVRNLLQNHKKFDVSIHYLPEQNIILGKGLYDEVIPDQSASRVAPQFATTRRQILTIIPQSKAQAVSLRSEARDFSQVARIFSGDKGSERMEQLRQDLAKFHTVVRSYLNGEHILTGHSSKEPNIQMMLHELDEHLVKIESDFDQEQIDFTKITSRKSAAWDLLSFIFDEVDFQLLHDIFHQEKSYPLLENFFSIVRHAEAHPVQDQEIVEEIRNVIEWITGKEIGVLKWDDNLNQFGLQDLDREDGFNDHRELIRELEESFDIQIAETVPQLNTVGDVVTLVQQALPHGGVNSEVHPRTSQRAPWRSEMRTDEGLWRVKDAAVHEFNVSAEELRLFRSAEEVAIFTANKIYGRMFKQKESTASVWVLKEEAAHLLNISAEELAILKDSQSVATFTRNKVLARLRKIGKYEDADLSVEQEENLLSRRLFDWNHSISEDDLQALTSLNRLRYEGLVVGLASILSRRDFSQQDKLKILERLELLINNRSEVRSAADVLPQSEWFAKKTILSAYEFRKIIEDVLKGLDEDSRDFDIAHKGKDNLYAVAAKEIRGFFEELPKDTFFSNPIDFLKVNVSNFDQINRLVRGIFAGALVAENYIEARSEVRTNDAVNFERVADVGAIDKSAAWRMLGRFELGNEEQFFQILEDQDFKTDIDLIALAREDDEAAIAALKKLDIHSIIQKSGNRLDSHAIARYFLIPFVKGELTRKKFESGSLFKVVTASYIRRGLAGRLLLIIPSEKGDWVEKPELTQPPRLTARAQPELGDDDLPYNEKGNGEKELLGSRSEVRSAILNPDEFAAATLLFRHLAVKSQNIPKDNTLIVLGNPYADYAQQVVKAAQVLNPSEIAIVGKGNGEIPERDRLAKEITALDPALAAKLAGMTSSDLSMHTGQNVTAVVQKVKDNALHTNHFVLTQISTGMLLSLRIFEKQWAENAAAMNLSGNPPTFYTYPVNFPFSMEQNQPITAELIFYLEHAVGQIERLRNWPNNPNPPLVLKEGDLTPEILQAEKTVRDFLTRLATIQNGRSEVRGLDPTDLNKLYHDIRPLDLGDQRRGISGIISHVIDLSTEGKWDEVKKELIKIQSILQSKKPKSYEPVIGSIDQLLAKLNLEMRAEEYEKWQAHLAALKEKKETLNKAIKDRLLGQLITPRFFDGKIFPESQSEITDLADERIAVRVEAVGENAFRFIVFPGPRSGLDKNNAPSKKGYSSADIKEGTSSFELIQALLKQEGRLDSKKNYGPTIAQIYSSINMLENVPTQEALNGNNVFPKTGDTFGLGNAATVISTSEAPKFEKWIQAHSAKGEKVLVLKTNRSISLKEILDATKLLGKYEFKIAKVEGDLIMPQQLSTWKDLPKESIAAVALEARSEVRKPERIDQWHEHFRKLAKETESLRPHEIFKAEVLMQQADLSLVGETVLIPASKFKAERKNIIYYLSLLLATRGVYRGTSSASVQALGFKEGLPSSENLFREVWKSYKINFGKTETFASFGKGIRFTQAQALTAWDHFVVWGVLYWNHFWTSLLAKFQKPEMLTSEQVGKWLDLEFADPLHHIADQVFTEFGENLALEYQEVARVLGAESNHHSLPKITAVLVGGITGGKSGEKILQGIHHALEGKNLQLQVSIGKEGKLAGARGAALLGLQQQRISQTALNSIGFDLGGSGAKLAVYLNGVFSYGDEKKYQVGQSIAELIKDQIDWFSKNHQVEFFETPIYIALPGPVTPAGDIVDMVNLETIKPGSMGALTALRAQYPNIKFVNDADAALFGQIVENNLTKGVVVGNTLGTGLGLTIARDGKLLTGPMEAHIKAFSGPKGLLHNGFEMRGDLESYASSYFVIARAKQLLNEKAISLNSAVSRSEVRSQPDGERGMLSLTRFVGERIIYYDPKDKLEIVLELKDVNADVAKVESQYFIAGIWNGSKTFRLPFNEFISIADGIDLKFEDFRKAQKGAALTSFALKKYVIDREEILVVKDLLEMLRRNPRQVSVQSENGHFKISIPEDNNYETYRLQELGRAKPSLVTPEGRRLRFSTNPNSLAGKWGQQFIDAVRTMSERSEARATVSGLKAKALKRDEIQKAIDLLLKKIHEAPQFKNVPSFSKKPVAIEDFLEGGRLKFYVFEAQGTFQLTIENPEIKVPLRFRLETPDAVLYSILENLVQKHPEPEFNLGPQLAALYLTAARPYLVSLAQSIKNAGYEEGRSLNAALDVLDLVAENSKASEIQKPSLAHGLIELVQKSSEQGIEMIELLVQAEPGIAELFKKSQKIHAQGLDYKVKLHREKQPKTIELIPIVRAEVRNGIAEADPSFPPVRENIVVIGTGFVGATKAILMAQDWGHNVIGVDIDPKKVETLNKGILPNFIPDLQPLLQSALSKQQLKFTTDYKTALEGRTIVFLALPTPQSETGEADTHFLEDAVRNIADLIEEGDQKIIVTKSTAPPALQKRLKDIARSVLQSRGLAGKSFLRFASEPEFLREGSEVPDDRREGKRRVEGADEKDVRERLKNLYLPQNRNPDFDIWDLPIIETDLISAPLIKYAANGYRALKISFINYLSWLTDELGLDIESVANALGQDPRIIRSFLNCGVGFGGSCFPKDVAAAVRMAADADAPYNLLLDSLAVNEYQWRAFVEKIVTNLDGAREKNIVILGGAFKPGTDDVRESRAILIIRELLQNGARIKLFDPVAVPTLKKALANDTAVEFYDREEDLEAILQNADGIVLATEWDIFKTIDFSKLKGSYLGNDRELPHIFDGRNAWNPETFKALGYAYDAIGRGLNKTYRPVDEKEFIANARELFLALRISYVNQIAEIADALGGNIRDTLKGLGYDQTVGSKYLTPGIGFGGYHLPRAVAYFDLLAANYLPVQLDEYHEIRAELIQKFGLKNIDEHIEMTRIPFTTAISEINEKQIHLYVERAKKLLDGNIRGKRIAVLGLSFKPDTYSIENTPALKLIEKLINEGADVIATDDDTQTVQNMRRALERAKIPTGRVTYENQIRSAVANAELSILATESSEFTLDLFATAPPESRKVVDGRHMFDPEEMAQHGVLYASVGVKTIVPIARAESRSVSDIFEGFHFTEFKNIGSTESLRAKVASYQLTAPAVNLIESSIFDAGKDFGFWNFAALVGKVPQQVVLGFAKLALIPEAVAAENQDAVINAVHESFKNTAWENQLFSATNVNVPFHLVVPILSSVQTADDLPVSIAVELAGSRSDDYLTLLLSASSADDLEMLKKEFLNRYGLQHKASRLNLIGVDSAKLTTQIIEFANQENKRVFAVVTKDQQLLTALQSSTKRFAKRVLQSGGIRPPVQLLWTPDQNQDAAPLLGALALRQQVMDHFEIRNVVKELQGRFDFNDLQVHLQKLIQSVRQIAVAA